MKYVFFFVSLTVSFSALGEDDFERKIYTPEVVVDQQNHGPKGAVQLLWQKSNNPTQYEVEVSNGKLVYSQVGPKHFHHVMLYFDKSYQWRVREVSADHTTEFTPWRPLKVVKDDQDLAYRSRHKRQPVSVEQELRQTPAEPDVDHFVLDTGE